MCSDATVYMLNKIKYFDKMPEQNYSLPEKEGSEMYVSCLSSPNDETRNLWFIYLSVFQTAFVSVILGHWIRL